MEYRAPKATSILYSEALHQKLLSSGLLAGRETASLTSRVVHFHRPAHKGGCETCREVGAEARAGHGPRPAGCPAVASARAPAPSFAVAVPACD